MLHLLKACLISCFIISLFLLPSCAHARPVRPGPNFIWIKVHTTPAGIQIPGYWKYTGPVLKNRTWIYGHYNTNNVWVSGNWKIIHPPKGKKHFAPGHRNKRGRWVRGHWR